MERTTISSWIRQARHRAKRYDIYSDLTISDVEEIITCYKNNCAYCGNEAETLDHPFPLKKTAPNVQANVLTSCKKCKILKKSNDLIWMFASGHLEQEKYLGLLQQIFSLKNGDIIKKHVSQVTGIGGDND